MSIGKLGWTVAECYERPRDCTAQFTEPAAIRAAGRGDGRNQRRRYAWERAEDRNISSEGDTRGNARRTETEAARVLSGAKVRVGDNIHDGGSPPRGFTPPLGSVGSRRQRRQEAGLKRQRNRGEDGNWKIAQTQGSELRPTDIDCVVCGYGTRRRLHRWVGGNQAEGNWAGKTAKGQTDRQRLCKTKGLTQKPGSGRGVSEIRGKHAGSRAAEEQQELLPVTNNKHSVQSPAGVPARGPKGKAVGGKSERVEQVRD